MKDTRDQTTPPDRSIFDVLAMALAEGPGRFLLIGGHSLPAHGYDRTTDDADLMVALSDFPWMEKVLVGMGYRRGLENPNFTKFHHVTCALEDVDVMFVNEQTFEKLWAASRDFQRGSALLRVPSPLHIIALKLHAIKSNPERLRKDLNDILELAGRNAQEVDAGSLRETCDRYGPPGIFDQIQALLK